MQQGRAALVAVEVITDVIPRVTRAAEARLYPTSDISGFDLIRRVVYYGG